MGQKHPEDMVFRRGNGRTPTPQRRLDSSSKNEEIRLYWLQAQSTPKKVQQHESPPSTEHLKRLTQIQVKSVGEDWKKIKGATYRKWMVRKNGPANRKRS